MREEGWGCPVWKGLNIRVQGDCRGGCPTWQHLISQTVLPQWGQGPDSWLLKQPGITVSCLGWLGMFLLFLSEWILLCTFHYNRMKTESDTEEFINCSPLSIDWLIGGEIHNPQMIDRPYRQFVWLTDLSGLKKITSWLSSCYLCPAFCPFLYCLNQIPLPNIGEKMVS